MKRAITCVECWGYDVFDIAIRRVQQLDRGMYPANIIYRLLLESDFAVSTPSCQQFFLPCFYFSNIIYFEECTPRQYNWVHHFFTYFVIMGHGFVLDLCFWQFCLCLV
jgi:hypothetical protein